MRDGEGPGGSTRPVFLRPSRRFEHVTGCIWAALLMWGCGGGEDAGPAGPDARDLRIAIVSGDGQEAPVGSSLPDFLVVRVTLGATQPAEFAASWAFVLEPIGGGRTRLIERFRVKFGTSDKPWTAATLPVVGFGVFLMTRQQMLGLRERAEALARTRQTGHEVVPAPSEPETVLAAG